MPTNDGELFPSPARGKTRAPEHLTPPQIKEIEEWAERMVPWVSRGAFEAFTPVDDYIEEVLTYWASTGRMRLNWAATVKTRIRTVERRRVESLARRGSEEAKLALRAPTEWARRYDRKVIAVSRISSKLGEGLIRPSGGTALRLAPRPDEST